MRDSQERSIRSLSPSLNQERCRTCRKRAKARNAQLTKALQTSSPKRIRLNAAVQRNEAATSHGPSPKLASHASEADHPAQADAQEAPVRSNPSPQVVSAVQEAATGDVGQTQGKGSLSTSGDALPQPIAQAPSGEQATMASANMVQQTSQTATKANAKAKKATKAPEKQKPFPNGNALSSYGVNVQRRRGMVSSMGLEKSYPVDHSVHPPPSTPRDQATPTPPSEEQDPQWQDPRVKVPSMVETDQAELDSAPILSAYVHQNKVSASIANDIERSRSAHEVETALEEAGQPSDGPTYPRASRDRFYFDPKHQVEVNNHLEHLQANMLEYQVGDEIQNHSNERDEHDEEEIDSFENAPAAPRLNFRQQIFDLVEASSPAVMEQVKKEMGYRAEMEYADMPPTAVMLAATRDLQNSNHEIEAFNAAHQRELQGQDDQHRREMQGVNEENARLRQELALHMELLAAGKSAQVVARANDEFDRREAATILVDFSKQAHLDTGNKTIMQHEETIRQLQRQQEETEGYLQWVCFYESA